MPRTKCPKENCGKEPSFGKPGSRTAQFCALHAESGMVNVRGKRCEYPGCNTRPAFGVAFTKKVCCCCLCMYVCTTNHRTRQQ